MIQQGGAGLLLDPGLGKTSCVLSAFTILKKAGHVNKMLVVAPIRPLYEVWPAEIEKWQNFKHLTCAILHGPDKDWEVENPDGVDIFLLNPGGLAKWLLGFKKVGKKYTINPAKLKKLGVDMLVIDESTNFKNQGSQRFKALKKALNLFSRRYILTGTVRPNTLEDLFGQFYIVDGGNALGRYITHFRQEFLDEPTISEPFKWREREDSVTRVAERISPLSLQLTAKDHLQMPELIYTDLEISLPGKVKSTYKQVEDEFVALAGDGLILAGNAAAAGTKCRQIANGAVYTEGDLKEYTVLHDLKLDALEELLDELAGAPLLILYEFKHDLERILKRWPDALYIGGGVSPAKVKVAIQRFNAGDIPMLLGHPASMGHGLNMQGKCYHVCWFGITWNFEYYDQAIARVYRQGQKSKTVFVYHIVAKNTRDERVIEVLTDKESNQDDLFNALTAPV